MNYELRGASRKNRVSYVLCVLHVVCFFCITKVSAQENFKITNYFTEHYRDFTMMKISIVPPEGFVKDTSEGGFINWKYNTAIRAQEVREGIGIASAMFLKSFDSVTHKDSLGIMLNETFNFKINGFDAHLINLSGSIEGEEYVQWLLFIGDASETYIIRGYIPAKRKKMLEHQVRSSLLSVFYESARILLPPGEDGTTTSSGACSCHTKK